MKKWALLGAVAALLAVAGSVAYASIPDAAGVIHGCYKQSNGQLRVIDTGSCGLTEAALDWNEAGVQGAKGEPGLPGPPGPPGPAGVVVRTANDGVGFVTVTFNVGCYPGEKATGAGYGGPDADLHFLKVVGIVPLAGSATASQGDTPTGFAFTVENSSAGTPEFHDLTFQPYVLCAG